MRAPSHPASELPTAVSSTETEDHSEPEECSWCARWEGREGGLRVFRALYPACSGGQPLSGSPEVWGVCLSGTVQEPPFEVGLIAMLKR